MLDGWNNQYEIGDVVICGYWYETFQQGNMVYSKSLFFESMNLVMEP
jgi:hypothetical protein